MVTIEATHIETYEPNNSLKRRIKTSTINARHRLINGITKLITPKLYEDHQYGKYDFDYCFRVNQLLYLCQCLDKVIEVEGNIAEIGVYQGRTTVFLNKYLDSKQVSKKYYAFDTFSGFTSKDVYYETSYRQKDPSRYNTLKSSKQSFEKVMARNFIDRVIAVQADVNKYDLTTIGPLCFALLDVDLYLPMKKSLKELYSSLSPGGIIIVDDCNEGSNDYDGSYQAYKEFMHERNEPMEIVHDKLGVVRKTLRQN